MLVPNRLLASLCPQLQERSIQLTQVDVTERARANFAAYAVLVADAEILFGFL